MQKSVHTILLLLMASFILLTMTACNKNEEQTQSNKRDNSIKQVEIITDYINIRERSTTDSEILGKVHQNEIYTVIETDNLWVKIQTSTNITGWIISSYDNDVYIKYLETNGTIPEEQKSLDKITKNDSLDSEITQYPKIEWISDVPLSEIKCIKDNGMLNIQSKLFITKTGELYEFSTDKKYSNEQVCKKIETDVKFDRFNLFANDRDLSIIISSDEEFYYYDDGVFEDYYTDDILLQKINREHPNNYGYYLIGATSYSIYYYVEGNKIYQYKATYDSNENAYVLISDDMIDTIPEGESFVSLEGKIIKTDKSYYKLGTTNQEECNKYEDVKPILGLIKLESVSNEYNKISYFNGDYIIYKNDPNNLYIYNGN